MINLPFMDYDNHANVERLIAGGWNDSSYGNDACPSVERNVVIGGTIYHVRLWIDWVDTDMRECNGGQFSMTIYEDYDTSGDYVGEVEIPAEIAPNPDTVITENMTAIKQVIAAAQ